MAIDSLWLQNLTYPARLDRLAFDAIWAEGILGTGSFQITPSSPAAMTVRAATGIAVVQGDDQTNQGKYLIRNDATVTGIAIGAAPGFGQRNDLVVLKVRDPNAGGAAGNDAVVQVVVGTASASPVDPAVPASALVLARVRVPAGTISISAGLIDDLRVSAQDAYNTIPTGSITASQLSTSVAQALAPTGTIVAYGGSAAPSGWLICDGTAYATATYPALSAALSGAYDTSAGQASPGVGNFRVPILKSRIPAGLNVSDADFNTLGGSGGQSSVTLTNLQTGVAAHTHAVSGTGSTDFQNAAHNHAFTTTSGGSHSHSLDVENGTTTHSHAVVSADTVAGTPSSGSSVSAISNIVNSAGSHSHSGPTATENATHAHNVTSISATAAAPATASAAQAHTNLQPYLVVNYIIKT